ncbi:g2985 [Coccomyxa elongata]
MTAAAGHQRDTEDGDLRQISKESGLWVAAAALCGGALLSGGVHYLNTAKKLNEEGVDAIARIRAVPIAVKALAVSTAATAAVGAAAYVALQCTGMPLKDMADVSSWKGAVIVLQQHRDDIREEFQKRIQQGNE